VIAAGYTHKMDEFLASNPGLRSRFNRFIHFDDYTPVELTEIVHSFCAKASFRLTPVAESKLADTLKSICSTAHDDFGNARTARNLFEVSVSRQADRIVSLPSVDASILSTIEASDIPLPSDLDQRV
jgi:stage V sporulation protein K